MTKHEIINANSANIYQIPDESVNLIVTSPPYPMIEMWDEMFCKQDPCIASYLKGGQGIEAFNAMHLLLNNVWEECDRVLKENGFICVNIGDATRTIKDVFQLFSNHTMIINFFLKKGYSILPDIHWRKQSNSPNKFMGSGMYPAGAYVTYEHEYILIFRKGGKRIFKGNEKKARQKSAYFWEERNVWFSDLWDVRGVSQTISNKSSTRNRNASYPFEIPYRLINMYSSEGDTVLDPFGGLGTTTLAAMTSKRNSISVEIDPTIAQIALENISVTPDMLNKIIDKRLAAHKEFINTLPNEKKDKCYLNKAHNFLVKTRQEMEIHIQQIDQITVNANQITCTYK